MQRILVIGGTGNIGREVIAQLPDTGVRVRALARDPQSAFLPSHLEVMSGDLTQAETLDEPLAGVDTVFLVWQAPAAAAGPALERIVSRARRVVFLSSPYKTPHPFFQQPNPLRLLHAEIERLIQDSGCEWTFLRPGMLAVNAIGWWASQIRAGADVLRWPYADTPTAPIDERDIAAVAVHALCEDGHAGAEYVMTGPESLTQADQVHTIGSVIGRPLRLEEITSEQARVELLATLPSTPVLEMLLNAWAAGAGQPAYMTDTVTELTGKPARTFRAWVTDHVARFRPERQ